jgi:hypothetical protein
MVAGGVLLAVGLLVRRREALPFYREDPINGQSTRKVIAMLSLAYGEHHDSAPG